jgi:hypothetical protein
MSLTEVTMSKGISTQQQQILGAAVAVSRIRNGQPVARTPQPHPGFHIPVVTGVWPDISCYIASHLVAGVGLRRKDWFTSRLETTPAALAARSSISRAITSLLKRELLAYRPTRPDSDDYDQFGITYGYVLTEAGLAAGLPHEPTVPDLALRLWLMDDNHRKTWWHDPTPIVQAYRQIGIDEGCLVPRFLPAPGCDMPAAKVLFTPTVRQAPTRQVVTLAPVRVDQAVLAARIRALTMQNDPDAVRAELEAIAETLEGSAGLSFVG